MLIDAYEIIDKVYKGDIILNSSGTLKVSGIVDGNITVNANSKVEITGILNGNLIVSENAEAIVRGIVNSTITNYGFLTIFGIVSKLNNYSNLLSIKPDAIIDGKKY